MAPACDCKATCTHDRRFFPGKRFNGSFCVYIECFFVSKNDVKNKINTQLLKPAVEITGCCHMTLLQMQKNKLLFVQFCRVQTPWPKRRWV